jgi:hypothetical protein
MGVWVGKFILLNLLFWRNENRLSRMIVVVLTVIIVLFYSIGYATWMGLSKTTFKDDCEEFYDGDKQVKVCADHGAKVGLFSVLFNIIYSVLFVIAILKKSDQDETQVCQGAQNVEMVIKPKSSPAPSNEEFHFIQANPDATSVKVQD